ncbi:MAG: alpha/beta hydrolase [Chloroflexi bacterium]|nr:alpha/beta hydrolase [Chloroflexota bacterium]MDA1220232.1 alpha/beta hydrolase [Chloroflexota bacterium]
MTDYLLVHGAGQGAWSWGKVWGYMTAPVEHPPRLYAYRRANKVYSMDLPGHGADSDGDTSSVLLDECVQSIVRTVERQGLQDVILVGHGFAGWLILQAAGLLPSPPKRLVLIAGIVPERGRSMIDELPLGSRLGFQAMSNLGSLMGKDTKIPGGVVQRYLCNGMDPMSVVESIGYYGPLPVGVLKSKSQELGELTSPVTYAVLTRDRVLPMATQLRMAARIPNAEVIELESCHQVSLYQPKELADVLLNFA